MLMDVLQYREVQLDLRLLAVLYLDDVALIVEPGFKDRLQLCDLERAREYIGRASVTLLDTYLLFVAFKLVDAIIPPDYQDCDFFVPIRYIQMDIRFILKPCLSL